eukprot:XP_001703051.1 predicted protein [Chlamydomonas reinhardtii]
MLAITGQLVAYSGAGSDPAFGTATLALDTTSMVLSLTLAPGPGRTWPADPATVSYATHTSGAAWLAAGACSAPLAGDPNGAPLAGGLAGAADPLTLAVPLDGLGLAPGDSQCIWLQWYDGARACPNSAGSKPFGFGAFGLSCSAPCPDSLSGSSAGQLAGALAALDPEALRWFCMPLTWQLLGRVVRPYTSPCAGMDLDRVDLLVRGECMSQVPKALRRVALGDTLVSHHFTSHAWPQGGGAKAWVLSVTGLRELVPVPEPTAGQAQPQQQAQTCKASGNKPRPGYAGMA